MPRHKPTSKSSAGGPMLTGRFIRALGYAARLHAHQTRKGKDHPYIGHLLGVASLVIVDGCTDAYSDPKPEWLLRKQAYIERIRREPAEIQLVSAADKLHNAREVLADLRREGDSAWERFKGKKEGTLWYYRQMVNALSQSGRTPLVDELDRVVSKLERLAAPTPSAN